MIATGLQVAGRTLYLSPRRRTDLACVSGADQICTMDFEPLNVLLVGNDGRLTQGIAAMLRGSSGTAKVATVPTLEAGLAELAAGSYSRRFV